MSPAWKPYHEMTLRLMFLDAGFSDDEDYSEQDGDLEGESIGLWGALTQAERDCLNARVIPLRPGRTLPDARDIFDFHIRCLSCERLPE